MQCGYFDDTRREYVITTPRTPAKWINYIGTLSFGGFVDHTGGALLCKSDPALNRITKYIPQLPSADFKGTTLYLRFRDGDGYKVFSPFFVPTLDPYSQYECHVGLGYTRIVSVFYGIRTEATIFVPPGAGCEIRDIRITNLGSRALEIDAIPVVEYTHFDALKQFTNADWCPQTLQCKAHSEAGGRLVVLQYAFMRRDTCVNYFTSDRPVASFDTDRKAFLGENEYRSWANPGGLQQPELGNSQALRGDNITALLHHLGRLAPGASARLVTQLGQAASLAAAKPQIARYREPGEVDAALAALGRFWDAHLARFQAGTPEPSMDRMLNVHNARQCYVTKNWSRYLSLYQLGFGARGIGFRDSAQDAIGVMAHAPGEARDLIRMLLHVQKRNGSAMHQVNPLTMVATMGDARESEDRPQYYSDDHLWIVLAVCAYLKETGDFGFLEETVPYYEKDRQEQPQESGSVLDHLRRALAFTRGDTGQNGLPLLGYADWNDTVNLPTGAESIFTAALYGKALLEAIDLMRALGDPGAARAYRADYDEMRARFNAAAWDGEWYVGWFDRDGRPLGSHTNEHSQIYINGQSWPVIAGYAPADRARTALDSLRARLNTRHGVKISAPGFDGFDPAKGGVTTYPPGAKENGGIFLHTNPWVIIAEALLGDGDRAFEYYHQINPAAQNEHVERYECEPYVYAQNILSDEHPQFGLARNSWLSGTAAWAFQAASQSILGIQPTYSGLRLAPCIPAAWNGFKVTRFFRGAWYDIEVSNPGHVNAGMADITVDEKAIEGDTVPVFGDGQRHRVKARMSS